jgi:hypothetical protein
MMLASSPTPVEIVQQMDAPVVVNLNGSQGASYSASFTGGGAAVSVVSPAATITHADGGWLNSLTATISNPLDGSAESLQVASSVLAGTTITATPGNGSLTLSGADTAADYQKVLRAITYVDTASTPNTTARDISFVATDGINTSATVTTLLSFADQQAQATTTAAAAPVSSAPSVSAQLATDQVLAATLNDGALSNAADNTGKAITATATLGTVGSIRALLSTASTTSNSQPTPVGTGSTAGDSGVVTISGAVAPSLRAILDATVGAYSVTPTITPADSGHTAQASQTDTAGNTGTSTAMTFTIDTPAPTVAGMATPTTVAANPSTSGQSVTIAATAAVVPSASSITTTATSQDKVTAAVAGPISLPQANGAAQGGAATPVSKSAACDAVLQTTAPTPSTLDPLWIIAIQQSDQDHSGDDLASSEAIDAVLAEYDALPDA